MSTTRAYSYNVAYGRATRIVMRWSQKYATYDIYSGKDKVGDGDAFGKPYDKRVTSQSILLW